MNEQEIQKARDLALVNELLSESDEHTCVEFKHNNDSKEMIGKLISALSNAARINQQDFGYILWGIEDGSKNIVGNKL